LQVGSVGQLETFHQFCDMFFCFHTVAPSRAYPKGSGAQSPRATCATSPSTASAESSKATPRATHPAPPPPPPTSACPPPTKQRPEKNPKHPPPPQPNKDGKEHQDTNKPAKNPPQGGETAARTRVLSWTWRLRTLELHMSIFRDHLGHEARHQQQGRAVLVLFQPRNYLASKAADLPIRQDGLQPITHFDPIATIIHRQQDQHAAVFRLRSDAPGLVEINRVAFNIGAVE